MFGFVCMHNYNFVKYSNRKEIPLLQNTNFYYSAATWVRSVGPRSDIGPFGILNLNLGLICCQKLRFFDKRSDKSQKVHKKRVEWCYFTRKSGTAYNFTKAVCVTRSYCSTKVILARNVDTYATSVIQLYCIGLRCV